LNIRDIVTADGSVVPPKTAAAQPSRNTIDASANRYYGYAARRKDPIDITSPLRNDYRWRLTVNDLEPQPIPFTAEGRRIFEATEPWHDPSLRCMAPGLPRIFGAPYNMDIVDAGDHYLFVYIEHNAPRRIWMDGRA